MDTYEKKYNEALEMARNLYAGVHGHNKAMLEQIFPELRESEADEKIIQSLILEVNKYVFFAGIESNKIVSFLKSLRPQHHKEIYQAAKRDLTIKFMNYLDENRPAGKMSLSNGECEDIDKAFKENDWAKIIRYIEKYQPHWKPSEEQMSILRAVKEHVGRGSGYWGEGLGSLIKDLERLM